MPTVRAGVVELYYESLGEGTPMVLQTHDHTPWLFAQAPVFSQRYRFPTYEGSREWASWIPGARFVILPGAHHAAPREAAPAWNAAVQRFLDENGLGAK